MVMFIYRPEYYNITADEDGNTTQGLGELIIAKHRNGSTEDVKIRFVNHLAKFTNWDSDNFDFTPAAPDVDDQYGAQILRSSKFDEIDDSGQDEVPF